MFLDLKQSLTYGTRVSTVELLTYQFKEEIRTSCTKYGLHIQEAP